MASSKKAKKSSKKKAVAKRSSSRKAIRKTQPAKKKSAAKKTAKKKTAKKAAVKKQPAGKSSARKPVVKKKAAKKVAKKSPVKSRVGKVSNRPASSTRKGSAVKKSSSPKPAPKKRSSIPVKRTKKESSTPDIKDTLRNLTEETITREPGTKEKAAANLPANEADVQYTNTEQEGELNTEPQPWVKVKEHIPVDHEPGSDETKAENEKEEKDEEDDEEKGPGNGSSPKTDNNPGEGRPFDKFTPKAESHQKGHFTSKPKGGVKPSGKKPLWN